MKIENSINHKKLRAKTYPSIGDQLDAIQKGFSYMADQGIDIGPDARNWIDSCCEVKDKFTKQSSKE